MGQLFSKWTKTDDDETFYSLDETPAVEVAFLKTKFQSIKTDTGEVVEAVVVEVEEVAELRTKAKLRTKTELRTNARTSNFRTRFGGFLSLLWLGPNTPSHEDKTTQGKTVNHLTFSP